MKKFYLFVLKTFILLFCFVSAADAQFNAIYQTVPGITGNVSQGTTWVGGVTPPTSGPCVKCQIIINGGNITQDWLDIILRDSSQILITGGATVNINNWTELRDSVSVIIYPNSILYVNDELDVDSSSYIQLADNTVNIDATNAGGNPTNGPIANALGGSAIIRRYPVTATYDVVLSDFGMGNSSGSPFISQYNINCNTSPPPPLCGSGLVYGPAVTAFGPDGFFEFVATTPLPVTLVQFAAILNSDHSVGLSWSTSQETNADYFSVLRSADGTTWQQLGTVKAKGFSSITSNYAFTDHDPLSGINYYRLKMVDQDGKFQYSKIVTVSANSNSVPLVVYNNPFTDAIRIKVNTGISQNLSLVLTDMLGKVIIRQNLNAQVGDNLVNLYPTGATQGTYVLSIQGVSYSQTVKLLKQ
ncbi:MAG TPA: T9SS type A sorting domain-containing protein [Puia sp.]|nr:T9SS type A sorting domain-containing protein [Puia sp.]